MKQSPDPRDRMGIYKCLSDVPPEQRLGTFSEQYENDPTYEQFLKLDYLERVDAERTVQTAERAGRRWKAHMESCGRHHALATPADVEAWMDELLDEITLNTAYNVYWTRLEQFYMWLQRRIDHPHVYHPVLMAAAEYPIAGRVWEKKLGRWRGASND